MRNAQSSLCIAPAVFTTHFNIISPFTGCRKEIVSKHFNVFAVFAPIKPCCCLVTEGLNYANCSINNSTVYKLVKIQKCYEGRGFITLTSIKTL